MGVQLTKFPQAQAPFSSDGTFVNPVMWEVATTGGVLEAKYYISMEDPYLEYCIGGRLYATDSSEADESSWFSFAADEGGQPGTYESEFLFELPLGSEIPVWVRLSVPDGLEEEPKEDTSLVLTCIGYEVTE